MPVAVKRGEVTREAIIDAAFETVRRGGLRAATARGIATAGGFNQALIFYHFGSVTKLLLAALDRSSEQRMLRYRSLIDSEGPLAEKIKRSFDLYAEDIASGHVTHLTELLAASLNDSELAAAMSERVKPWFALAEEAVAKALDGTPLRQMFDVKAAASAVIAMYLGLDMLGHLSSGRSRTKSVFELGNRVASLIASLTGAS